MTQLAFEPVADQPGLSRVLLIGDSISIGYTLTVRGLLQGRANVHRPADNCQYTAYGLEKLADWLGNHKWDVIHFNFGLHDMKYVDANGQNTLPEKGRQVAPLPKYEANLREIVRRLQTTAATLIWCSTTPVPPGEQWRVAGAEVAYNQAAARVMAEHGIRVNDLWTLAAKDLPQIQQPHNVHFTEAGYQVLGKQVAASIQAALQSHKSAR